MYAVRCGAVRCGAVRCGAVQCGAVRCGAVRCRAVPCRAVPCPAMPCHAMPCHAMPSHHAREFGSGLKSVDKLALAGLRSEANPRRPQDAQHPQDREAPNLPQHAGGICGSYDSELRRRPSLEAENAEFSLPLPGRVQSTSWQELGTLVARLRERHELGKEHSERELSKVRARTCPSVGRSCVNFVVRGPRLGRCFPPKRNCL